MSRNLSLQLWEMYSSSVLPLFFVSVSAPLQIESISQWALCIPTYGLIVQNHPKLFISLFILAMKQEQTAHLPPCHIFVPVGSTTAESPQRKRCQSSNYKQQIYSGQPPQRRWSFVKAEQRKMPPHNRGVVSVLFTLDELLSRLCWNI